MPTNFTDGTIERGHRNSSTGDASHALFDDAYSGLRNASQSILHDAVPCALRTTQALGREAALVTTGSIGGAIAEAQRDPESTLRKAGTAFGVGAVGTIMAIEAPVVAPWLAAAGALTTAEWLVRQLNPFDDHNQHRNANVGKALLDTWHSGDRRTFDRSLQVLQDEIGAPALDTGFMMLGGAGSRIGAANAHHFRFSIAELSPAPAPNYYAARTPTLYSRDARGSIDDLSFFKRRNGRVSTDSGSPATLEARLAARDKAKNLEKKEQTQDVKSEKHDPADWPPPPPGKSFWMRERYGRFHH
ncbi:MAG: hypothetical protein K2Z81_24185 [Cyanobacteria bacterium]|nr:hypothetical protein [Cyanobacteriota bacterium]